MGAKGSVEAAKMNSDNWGHIEVGLLVEFVMSLALSHTLCTVNTFRLSHLPYPELLASLMHDDESASIAFHQR